MTEPAVASLDATNIGSRIESDGGDYVLNGRKWWISVAGDLRCSIFILMGKTDLEAERHKQPSVMLVPRDTTGEKLLQPPAVYGYDQAPHGHFEIDFEDMRVPAMDILLGEGAATRLPRAASGRAVSATAWG